MESRARELLRQAGVQTPLDEDELQEIMSGSPSTGGGGGSGLEESASSPSVGGDDYSLPSAMADELRSPARGSHHAPVSLLPDAIRHE